MDGAPIHPFAANDRCTVVRATPFHQTELKTVLDSAAIAGTNVPADFQAARLLSEQFVFLAYAQDRPIGCIMAMPGATTVLHGLFVLPDERAKGHGSELIRSSLATFEFLNQTRTFWTAVDPALIGASERFLKFGFEIVQELCEDGLQLMTRSAAHRVTGMAPFKTPTMIPPSKMTRALQAASVK